MKKQMKFFVQLLVFMTILLSSSQVLAFDITDYLGEIKFSENYLKYLELSDEEKENVIAPRMYNIPQTTNTFVTNPLKVARNVGSKALSKYSLRDIIPENMVTKNQQDTQTCFAFSILGALESTLAVKNYKNNLPALVYDFSERHMEYATSQTFLNGVINEKGYAKELNEGGTEGMSIAYLTNGTGAIPESEMPFENNANLIDIKEIQNKTVVTQVNDTIAFPSLTPEDDTTKIRQQMKNHIMNYGAIDAGIHGASIFSNFYNIETGAIYCNEISETYKMDHAVIIVGWDDNYSKDNFLEGNRPSSDGAWIIRNSWGTEYRMSLKEIKEFIYELFAILEQQEIDWIKPEDVPTDLAKEIMQELGFTLDGDDAVAQLGDNGFMYISYEDVYIYSLLTGIIDAQTEIEYENIYQYDYYGSDFSVPFNTSKLYLGTVFDRKTSSEEYLTQVAINLSQATTCKVYVNPNGTSKLMDDLQQIQLKTGESETFDAGYHTIEFLNPIKINSDSFVVVLELEGTQTNTYSPMIEFNFGEYTGSYDPANAAHFYDNVTVESGKCFWTLEEEIYNNDWIDCSNMYEITEGVYPNFDTTIKAFTTSNILENLSIATPPAKTLYMVGEDFDATGMVVKANYANGMSEVITDYTITNGENLGLGQTSVTINYEGKTVTQSIQVVENTVESIAITTPPTKTEYWAGEDFDTKGMVVEATYKDGMTQVVTEYTIQDGQVLKNNQTTVTIEFDGKTTTQAITVKENSVTKIEIIQEPTKTEYVVGQNFKSEGMIVKAIYESGMQKEVTDYTVIDGTNLQPNQITVTIEYEGQTTVQAITVVEKAITGITVKTMPSKTEYIQNKEELDLTGGVIEISYNDGTKEELSMNSSEITVSGFDNEELGIKTIILTYQEKTVQFNVEVKELPKPENSNFGNAKATVLKIKVYDYTNDSKKDYEVVDVQISNLIQATVNDNMEYYYSLSANPKEENIANWVKINNFKNIDGKMQFEINTKDITNYAELVVADKLYLYVKEVAIRNNLKKELITPSLELQVENTEIEQYVDDEKKQEVNSEEITNPTPGEQPDNTLAPGKIPQAGKNALIIFLALAIILIGRITYWKYKDIELK